MISWYKGLLDKFGDRPTPAKIPASLFIQDKAFGLEELPFDLIIDESHKIDFDITDHAVENGVTISDHVQQRLRSIAVTGMFTNHPISGTTSIIEKADEISIVDPVDTSSVTATTQNVARDVKWESLKKIAQAKKKVRLITSLEIYDEMIIESLTADRGPQDGEAITFKMTLREIRTAYVDRVKKNGEWMPPEPAKFEQPKQKAMAKKKTKGKKKGKEVDVNEMSNKLANMNSRWI